MLGKEDLQTGVGRLLTAAAWRAPTLAIVSAEDPVEGYSRALDTLAALTGAVARQERQREVMDAVSALRLAVARAYASILHAGSVRPGWAGSRGPGRPWRRWGVERARVPDVLGWAPVPRAGRVPGLLGRWCGVHAGCRAWMRVQVLVRCSARVQPGGIFRTRWRAWAMWRAGAEMIRNRSIFGSALASSPSEAIRRGHVSSETARVTSWSQALLRL